MNNYEGQNYNPRRITGLGWLLIGVIAGLVLLAVWIF